MGENVFPTEIKASTALAEVDSGRWPRLRCACDAIAAWGLPSLATRSGNGCMQRTVVLEAVDTTRPLLMFHTDVRSGKVTDPKHRARIVYVRDSAESCTVETPWLTH